MKNQVKSENWPKKAEKVKKMSKKFKKANKFI